MSSVLFVEDDPISALCLTGILEDAGHLVRHANTTDDAAQMINDQVPDVLISDWNVAGGLEPWEVAKMLRDKSANAKIFFTTGYPQETIHANLQTFGEYFYFAKPVDMEKLVSQI